ncbi:MAG: hypothetical protein MN733_43325 [Nitrososphaera sp.]|nr:hypothetical protein [Nitrososphaera sp.]
MPPSGYNHIQAESICDFLRSCVQELILENRILRDSQSAIQREIDSITRDLEHKERPGFERELLGLTKAFYEALLKGCPKKLDQLTEHADNCLADFRSRILDIHVAV